MRYWEARWRQYCPIGGHLKSNNTFTFAFICFCFMWKSESSILLNRQFNKNSWMRWRFSTYFVQLFLTSRNLTIEVLNFWPLDLFVCILCYYFWPFDFFLCILYNYFWPLDLSTFWHTQFLTFWLLPICDLKFFEVK